MSTAPKECIHEMAPGTCGICDPRPGAEPDVPEFVIKAQFPSQCAECFKPIVTGAEITKGSFGQWVHLACR